MRALPRTVTSLDRPLGEDDGATLGDVTAAPDDEPFAELDVSLRNEALERALDQLPERDAEVLRLRFGLGDQEPLTLSAVGRPSGSRASGCARSRRPPCAAWPRCASSRPI